jgi:hypothetical protein
MYEELYTKEVEKAINITVKNIHQTTGIDRDELLEVAHDTFMLCAEKFNPSAAKFHTFYSKSLFWKMYNYARRGSINGGKKKNGEFYGRMQENQELERYHQYTDSINSEDNGSDSLNLPQGAMFCGREVKGWKEEESDLLIDITLQSMSRDARQMHDEIIYNYNFIMERNFRERSNMSRAKAKQHAIYDYFHGKGWDEYRITSALREIRENLKAA